MVNVKNDILIYLSDFKHIKLTLFSLCQTVPHRVIGVIFEYG